MNNEKEYESGLIFPKRESETAAAEEANLTEGSESVPQVKLSGKRTGKRTTF